MEATEQLRARTPKAMESPYGIFDQLSIDLIEESISTRTADRREVQRIENPALMFHY